MQIDFSSNYFELFGLSPGFAIDEPALAARFRELQKATHPDRFASGSDAERRWSVQAAGFVNEAYQTLHRALQRAVYLLSLNGVSLDAETDTQMDPMFLMQQMELREALEAVPEKANPDATIATLRQELRAGIAEKSDAYREASAEGNWDAARTVARQWQFLDKLQRELGEVEERLDNARS